MTTGETDMGQETFREITPAEMTDNPFTAFGKEWALLTAGKGKKSNMMTIAWGALGVLWHREVCFVFVRPPRHTYRFTEAESCFSVGFFPERYRDVLQLCGSISGAKEDKIAASKLTLLEADGCPYFAESRLTLICRKISFLDIDPHTFLDATIGENYPKKDYHRMYVGEIAKVLVRDDATGDTAPSKS